MNVLGLPFRVVGCSLTILSFSRPPPLPSPPNKLVELVMVKDWVKLVLTALLF